MSESVYEPGERDYQVRVEVADKTWSVGYFTAHDQDEFRKLLEFSNYWGALEEAERLQILYNEGWLL